MIENEAEVSALVFKLNGEVINKSGDSLLPYEYRTNGVEQCVTFLEHSLWSSEDDERKWIKTESGEELEPLEPFIKRETMAFLRTFQFEKI